MRNNLLMFGLLFGAFLLGFYLIKNNQANLNQVTHKPSNNDRPVNSVSDEFKCGKLIKNSTSVKNVSHSTLPDTIINLMISESNKTRYSDKTLPVCNFLNEADNKQGYLIKTKSSKKTLIQAPHAHNDINTGKIVLTLLKSHSITAWGFLSSVDRHLYDLGQDNQSLINQVSQQLLDKRMINQAIQIHGFSNDKRQSKAGIAANIIISSGEASYTNNAYSMYRCLLSQFTQVYLFGYNINELGATKNPQNYLLDAIDAEAFVHIELSKEMRVRLLDLKQLSKFAFCLNEGSL